MITAAAVATIMVMIKAIELPPTQQLIRRQITLYIKLKFRETERTSPLK